MSYSQDGTEGDYFRLDDNYDNITDVEYKSKFDDVPSQITKK